MVLKDCVMKRILPIIFALAISLLFLSNNVYASVEAEEEYYTVSYEDGMYSVSLGDEDAVHLFSEQTLSGAISSLEDSSGFIYFDSLECNEDILINDSSFTLGGYLRVNGDVILNDGADITLKGMDLVLNKGSLRVKGGKLSIDSGRITSFEKSAVSLEFAASSTMRMWGGEIVSSEASSAVTVSSGTAILEGGAVNCKSGAAIYNSGTLHLGGSVSLEANGYEVITSSPIHLSVGNKPFSTNASIQYLRVFNSGELTPIFFKAKESHTLNISLFDESGKAEEISFFSEYKQIEEKSFCAVYKPYKVSYYVFDELYKTENYLYGELIDNPEIPSVIGYEGIGWFSDEDREMLYNFAEPVGESLNVYAGYSLEEPTFVLTGMETVYSGAKQAHTFAKLEHPLDEEGIYSFEWKNELGETVSSSSSFYVKDVSDSGKYKCTVRFSVRGDTVEFTTPYVLANVLPKLIDIPPRQEVEYTGALQTPSFSRSPYYVTEEISGIDAGIYKAKLELIDENNYIFSGGEKEAYAEFEILQAKNEWIGKISINDIYYGAEPNPVAFSKFGNAYFLYSVKNDGPYSESVPSGSGRFFVCAVVDETPNYKGLRSEPVEFSVLVEIPVALSILTPPQKQEYFAFEYFDRTGLSFSLTYNSGRVVEISAAQISITYQKADNLRFGDSGVIAEYMNAKVLVPVKVNKVSYNPDISFSNESFVYDGKYHSIDYLGELPLGLDGIPLECSVSGGGTDVGKYEVVLSFSSASRNYILPEDIIAELIIQPKEVKICWESLSFVYDGEVKIPLAYYNDVNGAKHYLSVNGGAVYAGTGYFAYVTINDNNYVAQGAKTEFEILKACYDLSKISWSAESFIYDGGIKTVTLEGLPDGLKVVGYADNTAKDAGEYLAFCTLSYDSRNYVEPVVEPYRWKIGKAEYDLSSIAFTEGVYEYDGQEKYPVVSGSFIKGADGSLPSYIFSKGITDVSDEERFVDVIFSTDSKNYNAPKTITVRVTVQPKGIEVVWSNLSFTYSGNECVPLAVSSLCEISVSGGAIATGEYTATAKSLDKNYFIINNKTSFIIGRVDNEWIETPSIESFFEGQQPSPKGKSKYGQINYCFENEKGESVSLPLTYGEYYMVCSVPQGDNYNSLSFEKVKFNVLEVVPISLEAELSEVELFAFESLVPSCLLCTVSFNDGSTKLLSENEFKLKYENGESLRAGDKLVTVIYKNISYDLPIKVSKANYDTSEVRWSITEHTYNGEAVAPKLENLPAGVTVKTYSVIDAINAGEYSLKYELIYDTDNYNEPQIPDTTLIIHKKQVVAEPLSPVIYNGSCHFPVSNNPLYTVVTGGTEYKNAGVYRIKLELVDSDNYCFSGDGTCEFQIKPLEIKVTVNDCKQYLFGDIGEVTGVVDSALDNIPKIEFYANGDKTTAKCDDGNFSLIVTEGKIIKSNLPSPSVLRVIFLCFLLSFLLISVTAVIVFKREALAEAFAMAKSRRSYKAFREKTENKETFGLSTVAPIETALSVNAERADELITDSIAKTLIRKSEGIIETDGKRRVILNIDTLSSAFKTGETVDINILKEKGIIPSDSGRIKILARGVLDKQLKVYANEFSLSAIKMIALTGGEAIKISTVRKRSNIK